MSRRLAVAAILALSGCSHREEVPKFTTEELREVQSHRAPTLARDDEEFFAGPRGRQLVAMRIRQVYGNLGTGILEGAERVEVFRIVAQDRREPQPGPVEEIEGYRILATGEEQDGEQARGLSRYLLDGRLYFVSADCEERWGAAFRIWKGKTSVTLIVCFECASLEIYVRDASGHLVHQSATYYQPRSRKRDVLRSMAKRAFAADPVIQRL